MQFPTTQVEVQAWRDACRAETLRRSLHDFVVAGWHVLNPADPLVDNWHIGAICEHLEAVTTGQLRRLIINVAPRHTKSTLVSCMWPAWEWTRRAATRWLFTTYSAELTQRDSVNTRRIIESPWYKALFSAVQLTGDQNTKTYFETTERGYRLSTSVDGMITGQGGDRLVLDDPHNVKEAASDIERQKVKDFVDMSWSSRVNNPQTSTKTVVMQRVHEDDVVAHLMAKEAGWTVLVLPTKYVAKTTIVWFNGKSDPRKADGELLWPQRFGSREVAEAELDLGDYGFIAQHQQNPKGRSGSMFDVNVLRANEVKAVPGYHQSVRSWDLAATIKKDSKRSAGALMGKTMEKHYYIKHMVADKWRPDERNKRMKGLMQTDKGKVMVTLIEHQPAAAGEDLEINLTKEFAGHYIKFRPASGDKMARADSFAAYCNKGLVHVINDGTWNTERLYDELRSFPTGTYSDQVDALSQAFNYLAVITVINPGPVFPTRQEPDWRDQLPGEVDWQDKMQETN